MSPGNIQRGEDRVSSLNERWISEKMQLALAPVVVYALGFLYSYGYVSYFRVPIELVDVDLTTIIVASLALLVFFKKRFVVVILSWLAAGTESALVSLVAPLFLALDVFFYTGNIAASFCVFMVLLVITLIVGKWRNDRALHPFQGILDLNYLGRKTRFPLFLSKYGLSSQHIEALQGIVFLGIFLFCWGHHQARTQETFSVLQSDPGFIVVEMSGSRIVCVGYDSATRTLTNALGIYTLPLRNSDKIVLAAERIGPLKRGSVPNPE